MAAGLGVLRMPPAHFWSMTPRELMAALDDGRGMSTGGRPSRAVVDRLMARFPDRRG